MMPKEGALSEEQKRKPQNRTEMCWKLGEKGVSRRRECFINCVELCL